MRELVEPVERASRASPVVVARPSTRTRPGRTTSGVPCDQSSTSSRSGQRCRGEPAPQIVEHLVGNVDRERMISLSAIARLYESDVVPGVGSPR